MKIACSIITLIALMISSCSTTRTPETSIPKHDSLLIKSVILAEDRKINIWTPPGYRDATNSLPVLYMPDGGVQEDFPHVAQTLAELIQSKKIPPVILVGIENTKRRRDLTGPTTVEQDKEIAPEVGQSANFREFINTELVPQINYKYRTAATKGIIGESLAGLFVMETFLLKPGNFDFYIAFDPSLWWNDHYLDKNVDQYLAKLPNKNKVLWFASSGAEGMSKATQKVAAALGKVPPEKISFKYSEFPKEQHNTIFRAAKVEALIWALNQK